MDLHQLPRLLIPALWIGWAAYWLIAARHTKRARWRESAGAQALYTIPLILCYVLLAAPRIPPSMLMTRFVPSGCLLPSLGTLLVAAGLGLAVWARRHLGREWSGMVTLKQEHALIQTGPYRTLRHPIYTGLLLGVIGTAAAIGEWRGLLAVAGALIGFLRKINVEEDLMRRTFPEYEQYCKRTAALIPRLY
jgi:protein-S-isoprenylcysteine O-methyltransferase Ste14